MLRGGRVVPATASTCWNARTQPTSRQGTERDEAAVAAVSGFVGPLWLTSFVTGLLPVSLAPRAGAPACARVGALLGNDDRAPHSQVERANEFVGADRGCRHAPGMPAEEVEVD